MPTISQGVYTMGGVFADNLLEAFSGKVLGEEGFTKEDIMEVLFADMKKRKKSSGPKKPKALSGYTYYGQQGFAGISGATQNCSPLAYGSSVQSVINKQVLEVFVRGANEQGVNGYVANQNYAIGDIVRQEVGLQSEQALVDGINQIIKKG